MEWSVLLELLGVGIALVEGSMQFADTAGDTAAVAATGVGTVEHTHSCHNSVGTGCSCSCLVQTSGKQHSVHGKEGGPVLPAEQIH
jgi:microsomal dipeptidase-like Zn-dependent dipeptidase